MKDDMGRAIEASLADQGFRGVFVVNCSGVVTLDAGLPATDEALKALEAAFEERIESTEVSLPEEALAS